jgi:hypothetical protein
MTKKWIAINLALLLGAGLLGWQLVGSVKRFDAANDIAKIVPEKKKAGLEGGLPPLQTPKKYTDAEFGVIAAQNLFAESRKPEDKVDASAPLEAPPLDVRPILKGVIISGAERMAIITDPAQGNANAAQTRTMRPGDSYRGFILTDIRDENGGSMVLELGTRKEIIPLYDASKRLLQGGKTPILATRIVNFGPSQGQGVQGGVPAVVTASSTAPGRQVAAPGSGGGAVVRPNTPAAAAQPGGGRGGPARGVQAPQQMPMVQGQTWNQTVDSQGRVFINSPFGQIPVQTQAPPPPAVKK